MATPEGWYDDGQHPGQARWWDGTQWTEHFSPISVDEETGTSSVPDAVPSTAISRVGDVYRFPSSRGWASVEIVGESFREAEIRAAIGRALKKDEEVELDVDASLISEPDNPHDRNAVSVRINGQSVGYLDREQAVAYKPHLDRVIVSGFVPTTSARVWAVSRNDWQTGELKLHSNVRLALAEPHVLVPLNDPPEVPYSIVPWGGGLQVTGEDKHFDALAKYVNSEGRALLLVTLHRGADVKPRGTVEFVEVRVDGNRIGQMTAASSAHFFPAIDHLEKSGLTAAAWAHIKGSGLAAEVVLQAAKASEIESSWLGGPPVTIPRLVPLQKQYTVPNAYVPQKKSGGTRGPGGVAASSKSGKPANPAPDLPAKGGCAMIVASVGALIGISLIPDVGVELAGAAAAGEVALLWWMRRRRQASRPR